MYDPTGLSFWCIKLSEYTVDKMFVGQSTSGWCLSESQARVPYVGGEQENLPLG